ncbi:hypothetical protein ACQX1T_11870, partial [Corynebacterium diphtheriae]
MASQAPKTTAGLVFPGGVGQAATIHDLNPENSPCAGRFWPCEPVEPVRRRPPGQRGRGLCGADHFQERLEVPTNCEIGLYVNDQLAGRLFQEQSTSFNFPAGPVSLSPQAY